jgi:hypothetical protein
LRSIISLSAGFTSIVVAWAYDTFIVGARETSHRALMNGRGQSG